MIILLVIIGLSLLILGHEAGHFLVAKLSGMKVNEFGFGFPPRVFGIRRYKGKGWKIFWRKEKPAEELNGFEGGTIYSFNLLPFGGFVHIAGENDHMNENGEINDIPEADKAKLFNNKPIWKRSLVVLAGVIANFVLGWALISAVFMVGIPPKVVVGGVEPGSPAETVGIKAGDILQGFNASKEFIDFVNLNKGKEITLQIFRDGKDLSIKATPRINPGTGKGALGIYLSDGGVEKQSFFGAIGTGFTTSLQIGKETITAFWGMLKSILVYRQVPKDVVGPVGIVSIAAETGKLGILYFLQLLALISINLSVMNLLPFPALDGGRFLILLAEKAKGSPLPKAVEAWINGIGFLILIGLMVLITIRDVGRL